MDGYFEAKLNFPFYLTSSLIEIVFLLFYLSFTSISPSPFHSFLGNIHLKL